MEAMNGMRRWGAAALLGVGAALALSGCGSDEEADARSAMIDGKPIEQSIVELGGSCSTSGMAGRMSCEYEGSSFALMPNSWESKAGQRERECKAEQVQLTTQVLTNHRWMVTSDDESSLEQLREALASKGTPSEVVGYCDWDED